MLSTSFQTRLIIAWFGVVTLFVGVSLASGMPVTVGYGLSLFTLGFLPPMIVMAVFPGAPQRSLAEGIYAAAHTKHEVAARLREIDANDRARV